MNKDTPVMRRLVDVVASRKFFWIVLALLVAQAAWIALSGRYPMAFDEDFHLGIIRLYAHHLSPFWAGQPESADRFGAVARDPSYLYQYLMSFPYRLVNLFTRDQTIIVLWLRFINIGLFALGLVLFKKLLSMVRTSRAAVNICLLAFVLLPIVPMLAAQINYDNLLLPTVALAMLLTLRFDKALSKGRFDISKLLLIIILCLLASLVKYAFLPIFMVLGIFIIVRLWQQRTLGSELRASGYSSWATLRLWQKIALVTGLMLAMGLFYERIGINLVRYHRPVPDCSHVLRIEQCKEYGPWIRDYNFALNKLPGPHSPLTYSKEWFYGMWLRTFFAVGGPETTFETRGPLILPAVAAVTVSALGAMAVAITFKRLLRLYKPSTIYLFLAVPLSYIVFLWMDEYHAYVRTGQPVAINGRYLLPVLMPLIFLGALAISLLSKPWPRIRLGLAALAIICLAWGGGALTYILRSNDTWYWPNSAVRSANHAVQRVLGPITPGHEDPIEYL